jgi:hypothetical protein
MMHNWLEGLLQHHARVKWGIGGLTSNTSFQKNQTTEDVYEENDAETVNTLTDSMVDSASVDDMDVDNQNNQEQYGIRISSILLIFH